MCKFLLVGPKGHEKNFFKLLRKAGLLKEETDIQQIAPHVPPGKVADKRNSLGAPFVIYTGIDAKTLEDYQAHMLSKQRPGEKIHQCGVNCMNTFLKPKGADKVTLFNSPETMILHLQELRAAS